MGSGGRVATVGLSKLNVAACCSTLAEPAAAADSVPEQVSLFSGLLLNEAICGCDNIQVCCVSERLVLPLFSQPNC